MFDAQSFIEIVRAETPPLILFHFHGQYFYGEVFCILELQFHDLNTARSILVFGVQPLLLISWTIK